MSKMKTDGAVPERRQVRKESLDRILNIAPEKPADTSTTDTTSSSDDSDSGNKEKN